MSNESLHETFLKQGFLVIPNAVPSELCRQARDRAWHLAETLVPPDDALPFTTAPDTGARDQYFLKSARTVRLFNEPSAEGHPEGNSRPNKIGHALHDRDPFFKRFARLPIYEGVAESIGLQNPRLIQSMLMFKTAQGGGEVHWHQDATFLRCEPFPIVGFWIALEPATIANGCLHVVEGGHEGAVDGRFGLDQNGQPAWLTPRRTTSHPKATQPIEVAEGSLVVIHGRLPHASFPNLSRRSRLAFTLHLMDARSQYAHDNWLQLAADESWSTL